MITTRTLISFGLIVATVAGLVLVTPDTGEAMTKCRVKVDKKTGLIQVDATGVLGPLQWGGESVGATNSFFNDATCVASGRAKRCTLADPATLESKTPPASCTIHLDDGVTPCSAWIAGCTPGSRAASLSRTVDESGNNVVEIRSDIVKFRSPLPAVDAGVDNRRAALPDIGETESYCAGGDYPGEVGDSFECTSHADCDGVCTTGANTLLGTACSQDFECNSQASNDGVCASASTCTEYAVMVISGSDVYFAGFNVHVRSGSGATGGAKNGLGNLVVGYDEDDGADDKSGSHNLVVGKHHSYSSHGGFVAGSDNAVSGPYASVSGGNKNTASKFVSSVSGGNQNTASGRNTSVNGGQLNTASGEYSSVGGGRDNTASGHRSVVGGGNNNTASGEDSSVSGGDTNAASGVVSVVSGGLQNAASGYNSSVSGGHRNFATGYYSSVSGGSSNGAYGDYSSVSGGTSRSVHNSYNWGAGGLFELD